MRFLTNTVRLSVSAAFALGLTFAANSNAGITIDFDDIDFDQIEEGINNIKDKISEVELPACEDLLVEVKEKLEEEGKELDISDEDFLAECETTKGQLEDIISGIEDYEFERPEEGESIEIEIPECDEIVAKVKEKIADLPEDKQPSEEDMARLDSFCEDHVAAWEEGDWSDWEDAIDWDEWEDIEIPTCDEIIEKIEEKVAEKGDDEQPDMEKIRLVCDFFEADDDDRVVADTELGEIAIPSCDEVENLIDVISQDLPEEDKPTAEDKAEACAFFEDLGDEIEELAEQAQSAEPSETEVKGVSDVSSSTSESEDGEGGTGSFGFFILSLLSALAIRKRK